MSETCPECGADWQTGRTCQDHFHQMLFWENENPALGEVHHLAVLCYHLQHPAGLSAEWLEFARSLLADFVERGLSPQQARRQNSKALSSTRRRWKIKASPAFLAGWAQPPAWSMTAADVTAAGAGAYPASIHLWAASILRCLREEPKS